MKHNPVSMSQSWVVAIPVAYPSIILTTASSTKRPLPFTFRLKLLHPPPSYPGPILGLHKARQHYRSRSVPPAAPSLASSPPAPAVPPFAPTAAHRGTYIS